MRCTKHNRSIVGACNWCGKQVCPYCIGQKEGKKLYCEKCAMRLSTVKRTKVPPVKMPETRQQAEQSEEKKKALAVDEEGYLVLEQ